MDGAITQQHVVIVGAGIAGIACARYLTNNGDTTVTIMEARPDRYGGRICTNFKDWPNATGCEAEIGASWIHGMNDENPVTQLQRKLNLETFETDYSSSSLYSYASGEMYSSCEVKEAWEEYEKTRKQLFEASRHYEKDISYEQAIHRECLHAWFQRPLTQFLLTLDVEAIEGAPLSQISAKHYDPSADMEGFSGSNHFVVNGLSQILDSLVNGIGDTERQLDIQLGKQVTRVLLPNKDGQIDIHSSDGEVVSCDRVVIAVPLGVLKDDVIDFTPDLPLEYKNAIHQNGFGTINKLILEFDDLFWPADKHLIGLVGDDVMSRGFLWAWFNMYPVVGRPVLVGFTYSEAAYVSETLTEAELIEKALGIFGKVFGETTVRSRKVVHSLRTRWHADPHTRGSYSFQPVETAEVCYATLTQPVDSRLYFAGEHTARGFIGNVHGAYMSGVRAAKQILGLHDPDEQHKAGPS